MTKRLRPKVREQALRRRRRRKTKRREHHAGVSAETMVEMVLGDGWHGGDCDGDHRGPCVVEW